METVIGRIKRIVYESPTNDFKVFLLRRNDKAVISVNGEFPHLVPGVKIEVHGNFRNHPKYGPGFRADAHSFDHDNDARSISLYIQSIAKWIGPDRSLRLAEHFGADLERVIEQESERLLEVDGIGKKVAQSLVESWQDNRNLKEVKIFLHGLGLSSLKIRKIVTMYGPNTEEILRDNPWLLCFKGFGFSTCDYIASKLGKDMSDPMRWSHFILYALIETLHSGHLFLRPNELAAAFNKFNRRTPFPLKDGEINIQEIAPHLKHLIKEGYIVLDGNNIYELQSYFYESESARLLSKVLQTPDTCKLDPENAETFIKDYEKRHKIELSDAQRDAIHSFTSEKVLIVTGSPGTGKTTIVKAFVEMMKKQNISFELLTPTGISAKKLGDTAGHHAYTIHRRLGYRGNEWTLNSFNKYPTQAVIVDETSMVDQEVFYRLVSALYPSTKFVFVGDNDQLPSVGPGYVLKHLIKSEAVKTIFLDTIFRQEEQSEIIKEAKKIRDGDIDLTYFRQDRKADIWHIRSTSPEKIEKNIISIAQQIKDSNKTRADKKHFQIITPRNQGPLSVETLNTALQSVLNPPDPSKKEIKVGNSVIRKGDRVIIKKNNYDLDVFNGDIGKVVHITVNDVTVDIEDFGNTTRRVEIPLKIIDEMIKLAYSVTVHKSQGMEYPLVILPFIKAHGDLLLQRNLLYTAITRAKKKVIVLGQASAIEKAINNDKIQKRNTLFSERIQQWTKGEGTSLQSMFSDPENYQNVKLLKQLLSLEGKAYSDKVSENMPSKQELDNPPEMEAPKTIILGPVKRKSIDQVINELEALEERKGINSPLSDLPF